MPKAAPFDAYPERYERWFSRHAAAYHSELLAVRALMPLGGRGLEIGVGTGRFAGPLGVSVGVDPSRPVLAYAVRRGIRAVQGVAEVLPFADEIFDFALFVTTICFVDDARAMVVEARRVLKKGGVLIGGFIDRTSILGKRYMAHQAESTFYREATFHSAAEVAALLAAAGFQAPVWGQTLTKPIEEMQEIEPVRAGAGEGSFVVVRAARRG